MENETPAHKEHSFLKKLLRGPLPSSERYGKTNADGYTILDTEKLKKSPQFKTLVDQVDKFEIDPKFLNLKNGSKNGNHSSD